MITKAISTLLFCVIVAGSAESAEVLQVKHVGPEETYDPRKAYFVDLLKLALEETREEYGPYQLRQVAAQMYQGRQIRSLRQKLLDVVWSMTSREREELVRPIRIPLMKGLLGYRVFIIRRDRQPLFEGMDETAELKELRAVQGHDWPDTKILEANGFRVEPHVKYMKMFEVISSGRFDYFPRGILEAWQEVDTVMYENLIVEQKHLLIYPAAIYFFVHKDNASLAERLETGLRTAMEDGRFDNLFYRHPGHREAFKKLNFSERTVHYLDNPLLPQKTPLDRPKLWFRPDDVSEMD